MTVLPDDSTPSNNKGPCWWFAQCATYKDVQAIVATSDNLPPSDLVLCLRDALVRAEHHKPSLVPYIALELDHAEATWHRLEEFARWEQGFFGNIERNQTAKKAWLKIERAKIAQATKVLLFQYASFEPYLQDFLGRARRVTDCLETAARAARVVKERHDDPKVAKFAKRAAEKLEAAAQVPWVNPYSRERTLADALVSHIEIGSGWAKSRKASDAVRRYGTKWMLLVLHDYAQKHGVRIGWRRVAALAICAKSEGAVEERSLETGLSRLANQKDMRLCRPRYLAKFEELRHPRSS